jgi:lipid II:glycine glycyltransferase (peptidoglycan interpeptide bridge formation enzyme)
MSLRSRQSPSPVHEIGPYSVRVCDAPDDPEWDDFLEQAPGSAYPQTSCWGRVCASMGWRPVRVVVSDGARVVAGAQILTRPLPVGGNFGLVSRGPVISDDRPDLVGLVFDQMLALGRANKVQYLVVYAPSDGDWMCGELAQRGLRPSPHQIDYTATVRIDLQPELDELLARMRRATRRHLRSADKHVVAVRRGSEADLPIFNHLKDVHSARLGYTRRAEGYYTELWRALAPRGHVELFIAEYEGEPVSAALSIPFGDTCYSLEQPWSGEHGNLRSNELLEWHMFRWAKSEGYRFFDLMGVQRSAAEAMLAGEGKPSNMLTAESFKLAFGGDLVLLPQGYDHIYNPVVRFTYRSIPRKAFPSVMRFADRVRLRAWGGRQT